MPRIGQILSESAALTDHDVEEILNEQKATRARFGDAALALGKVRPDQVWKAWLRQLAEQPIDLTRFVPDAAAIAAVPAEYAVEHQFVPVRIRGDQLVIAAAYDLPDHILASLHLNSALQIVVAHASPAAVQSSLARIYSVPVPVAA